MAKNEYLCILPDKEGVIEKRLEVRGAHLEGVKPQVAAGNIVMGGAMLESHPAEGEAVPFKGSALLMLAESVEEVKEALSKDIYARTGVWDMEKVQIIPFKSAVRLAL